MSSIAHHLVSRGVDHYNRHSQVFDSPIKIPAWGFVLIGLTTAIFFLLAAAVSLSNSWINAPEADV